MEQSAFPWCAEASPASPSASPAPAGRRTTNAGSGRRSPESWLAFVPRFSSSRTCQGCEAPACVTCWPTLPASGSMRSGRVTCVPGTLARLTSAPASSSSLPTPTACAYGTNRGGSDASSPSGWSRGGKPRASRETLEARSQRSRQTPLASRWPNRGRRVSLHVIEADARRSLPTPTLCGDWNRHGSSPTSADGLSAVAGPSIRLREWMMGLPRDWLAVEESALGRLRATLSSSRAQKQSATRSAKRAR